MRIHLTLFGMLLAVFSVGACSEDVGGGAGGTAGSGGAGGSQTSTVTGVVFTRDDARLRVEGAVVRVLDTELSAITDSSGRFTLRDVPSGETFFLTEADGNWSVVDFLDVPDDTGAAVDLGVVPDGEIAAIATDLGRTLSETDGIVDITFFQGAEGGESGMISAPSDEPFTFTLAGVPVEQDSVIADNDGTGDLIFTSVDPANGPVTAEVTGVSGVTACYVDELPGTTYPIFAKAVTIVYAYCQAP